MISAREDWTKIDQRWMRQSDPKRVMEYYLSPTADLKVWRNRESDELELFELTLKPKIHNDCLTTIRWNGLSMNSMTIKHQSMARLGEFIPVTSQELDEKVLNRVEPILGNGEIFEFVASCLKRHVQSSQ